MTGDRLEQGGVSYEIVVKGHLDERWAGRFGEMTVRALPGGITRLCGPVADQPALYGILSRIRDLGLILISVRQIDADDR